MLEFRNSVIKIKNEDDLCCARAIVTMKAYCDFDRHTKYEGLQRANCARKKSQGTKSIGWSIPEGPCSFSEIETCQGHLTNYHLIVLSVDHNYQIIFKGPFHEVNKDIILMRAYI